MLAHYQNERKLLAAIHEDVFKAMEQLLDLKNFRVNGPFTKTQRCNVQQIPSTVDNLKLGLLET